MEIHNKNTLFENKLWKVTVLLHVNGTFSGRIVNKMNKISTGWNMHPINKCTKISSDVPKYLIDIIKTFVVTSHNYGNLPENTHIAI